MKQLAWWISVAQFVDYELRGSQKNNSNMKKYRKADKM